jgi:hypothetical protein
VWAECSIYKISSYLTGNTLVSATKPGWLMLFREIIAVYCENCTKHVNTLCGQTVSGSVVYPLLLLNLPLVMKLDVLYLPKR